MASVNHLQCRNSSMVRLLFASAAMYGLCAGAGAAVAAPKWLIVANNACQMPGSDTLFNSYNPPSVNVGGLVVFRARSKGGESEGGEPGAGEPTRGIYTRQMTDPAVEIDRCNPLFSIVPLVKIADGDDEPPVPTPTNLISGEPVDRPAPTFTEFPAFPRISVKANYLGFRGQSQPIWQAPDDTRLGTSSVYVHLNGVLSNAVSQLGALSGFRYLQVPAAGTPGIKFDQFPGAPSPTPEGLIVFKGNYTDGISKTGVFFRKLGTNPVRLIANTSTRIPNQPAGGVATFGSTAPPSAAFGKLVFAGFDNEDAPTLGGIYQARIAVSPPLATIIGINDPVPGVAGATFSRLGEAVSFDGVSASFWGGWGATKPVELTCPSDGNAALIQACRQQCPPVGGEWVCTAEVPVNQGIFLARNGSITPVALTGATYTDFLFWVFSGRPPGVGGGEEGEEGEAPRWRSSAFSAVYGPKVAFKASLSSNADGIFFKNGTAPVQTLLTTTTDGISDGTDGTAIDPQAPAGSKVVAVGIERDGLRNKNLVLNASMLDAATGESWAGVYLYRLP